MVENSNSSSDKANDSATNQMLGKGIVCKTREEYFAALEKWLQDVYVMQSFAASFPYILMCNQLMPNAATNNLTSSVNTATGIPGAGVFQFITPPPYLQGQQANEGVRHRFGPNVQSQRREQANLQEGIVYKIPAVWKRIIAELLDFVILLFVRLAITFVAVDFDIIDLEKYDFDLLNRNVKMDYKVAVEMTSEILLLEMIHRLVVCLFEAFWIRRGIGPRMGGATPGKAVLGIRVVLCERVTDVEGRPDIVLVTPGTDPGMFWAVARSLIKNLILAVLFPVCFVLFLFRHNRTGYDIICRTLVVEDAPPARN
ncbi:protein FAM8A1 [Schistocerca gregaria]|uniref:protein FAM8A1 n=1 Tax=Schistocerca gregaria TaxID=7010 RepID=UPI00211EA101|nr:protein FAM8A1 [Schistocerca gregaria]